MKPKTPFEEIDHKSILKRMIILCWVCLGVCLLVKIFGGKSFEIIVTNKRFLKICELIDNNIICLRLIEFAFYFITTSLYFNSIISHPPKYLNFVYIGLFLIKAINMMLGGVLEIFCTLFLPVYYKTTIKDSLTRFLGVNLFQLMTMFLRNLNMPYLPHYTLIGVIMSIDYVILLVLLNLYKNGGVINGSLGSILFQRRDNPA